jgi:hypothetical protein
LSALPALAACGNNTPAMPATCTDTDPAGYERALAAAPGEVRLPGGTPISECLWRVRSDAELQNLGAIVHVVAEQLALRARDQGDAAAARQLGYLGGAVAVGARRSNGISAELARRVDTAASGLDEAPAAVARALAEGRAAGARRG